MFSSKKEQQHQQNHRKRHKIDNHNNDDDEDEFSGSESNIICTRQRQRRSARKKARIVDYKEKHSSSESESKSEQDSSSSYAKSLSSSFSNSDEDESDTDEPQSVPQDSSSSEESEEEDQQEQDETNSTNKGKILKLRNNRWRIKQVPKDGNCLFSSMAILCQEEDDATSNSHHHHFKYRRLAVQAAINQCWSSVENDVNKLFTTNEMRHINSIEELQEAYKQKMMTVGIFGSDIEIRAAVEVLPINISYIQKYDDDNSFRVCNFGEDLKKHRKWLLLTGPLECGHFEPLIALGKIEEMRNGLYYDAEWMEEEKDKQGKKENGGALEIENEVDDGYWNDSDDSSTVGTKQETIQIENHKWEIFLGVPKDGNSLFATLAYLNGMNIWRPDFDRSYIVEKVIEKCWEKMSHQIRRKYFSNQTKLTDEDMKAQYMAKMGTNNEPGSKSIELLVASKVHPIGISCITRRADDENEGYRYNVFNYPSDLPKDQRKWVLCTTYDNGQEHFQPLKKIGKIKECLPNGFYSDKKKIKNDDALHTIQTTKVLSNHSALAAENEIPKHLKKTENVTKRKKNNPINQQCPTETTRRFKKNTKRRVPVLVTQNAVNKTDNEHPTKTVLCSVENCEEKFQSPSIYLKHMYRHHKRPEFRKDPGGTTVCPCPITGCETVCKNKESVYSHFNAEHCKAEKLKCTFCVATFPTNYKLKRHEKSVHKASPQNYPPRSGSTKTATESPDIRNFSNNNKTNQVGSMKTVFCKEQFCNEGFHSAAMYRDHLYYDHDHPEILNDDETGCDFYPCPSPSCQKGGNNKESLYSHFYLYHFAQPDSNCLFCHATFTKKNHLKRHVQCVHTDLLGVQPHRSSFNNFDNKQLKKLTNVVSPQNIHKEFPCWVRGCRVSFHTQSGLSRHLTRAHKELKYYKCPLPNCWGQYSDYFQLKFHVKESHGRRMEGMRLLPQSELDVTEPPIPCSVEGCETRFWDNTTAKRHLRDVHSEFSQYKCEWIGCEKSYKSKRNLFDHVMNVHEYFKQEKENDEPKHEDSDSHRYYYNGITKDQIVSHEITRLIQHRYVVQRKRFTVYFVLGFPNDLLETGLPISIPNRDWLAHLQDAENKQLTTLSLYVGSCENADISTYHTDPEKYKYSSIGQYLAEEKGKCYKVAAINCKSKEEMLTTEATAQQFIEIRYRAQTGDPNFSGGMVYEPMWTHTSVQFSMKTSDDRYDTFFNTAKNKSHNVFCLDNDCKELKHNAMAYQCHVSLELPFIGLVHVHDIFKEVVLHE